MWRIAVSDNFLYYWGWRFTRDWFDLLGGGTRPERIHDLGDVHAAAGAGEATMKKVTSIAAILLGVACVYTIMLVWSIFAAFHQVWQLLFGWRVM